MKKLFLPLQFIFLIPQFMFSQLESFDLSKYKLPEIKRKQLDLNFNFSESSRKTKTEDGSYFAPQNYNLLSNVTNFAYSSFVNRSNYQGIQNYSLRFSPRYEKDELDNNVQKQSAFYTSIAFYSENRFYFGKLWFFELDVISNGNSDLKRVSDNQVNSTITDENYNIHLAMPLKLGRGRIESIQDARLAVYIFEDLQNLGRLSRIPSDEEIIEFSQIISKLKNERQFDYRLRRISEIEKADSFLQAKGFVNQADAKYFTSVYDNWEYSAGPGRQSGTRLAVGLMPVVNRSRNYRRTEYEEPPNVFKYDNRYYNNVIQLIAEYKKETPVNLYWQRSMGAYAVMDLSNNKMKNVPDETEVKYHGKSVSASVHYGLGFFPNSRTSLTSVVYLNAFYELTNHESEPARDDKSAELGPGVEIYLNYYISPQLRLNVDLRAEYFMENNGSRYYPSTNYSDNNSRRFNQSANISFLYSIF